MKQAAADAGLCVHTLHSAMSTSPVEPAFSPRQLHISPLPPQLPLMLTPLPNITVYYTGYRIYSHYRALQVRVGACHVGWARLDATGAAGLVPYREHAQAWGCSSFTYSKVVASAAPSPHSQGCKALEECLEQLNSKQLRTLRDEVRHSVGWRPRLAGRSRGMHP